MEIGVIKGYIKVAWIKLIVSYDNSLFKVPKLACMAKHFVYACMK